MKKQMTLLNNSLNKNSIGNSCIIDLNSGNDLIF